MSDTVLPNAAATERETTQYSDITWKITSLKKQTKYKFFKCKISTCLKALEIYGVAG